MNRKASAVWNGDLKQGKGTISTESGTLKETQYSFSTRFENGVGTNPEELIAAAHAGRRDPAHDADADGGPSGAEHPKAEDASATSATSAENAAARDTPFTSTGPYRAPSALPSSVLP